jgi:cyclic dehypoxanthinyl futalosine synthase
MQKDANQHIKSNLLLKILDGDIISFENAVEFYRSASTPDLMLIANEIRKKLHPLNQVGWIIDRNVNTTNVCFAGCKFCNFHVKTGNASSYVTNISQYCEKIEELNLLKGNQLLLQGGMNPKLDLHYYKNLFKELKRLYPSLKLHALGPPEIVFLSKKENISFKQTLTELIESGLDSLPGAGAEILSDRVRSYLSKGKCSVSDWLEVMRQAHLLNLPTSATMMFGHIETAEERIQHLFHLRDLQNEKPSDSYGFLSFIPWPYQDSNTELKNKEQVINKTTQEDYIRLIAISRIVLNNIKNIQASWLTVGKSCAQLCLHAGANDMGSIMIEENVVSSAGANYKMTETEMKECIIKAGFVPVLRNQKFELI